MNNDPSAFETDNDGEFERILRKVAAGFTDVPEQELDYEINRAIEEIRAERYRARIRDQATRKPNS